MSRTIRHLIALAALLMLPPRGSGGAPADAASPLLHPLFQDHLVLQRDRPIAIWGWTRPGASVHVELAGLGARTRADAAGRWQLRLPALPAGGPHTLVASSGDARQVAADVLVGDVWLCSGQSNMELPVSRTLNAPAEIAGADNPRIRMLKVGQQESAVPRPRFELPVQWRTATPANVPGFSAACYYFARELQERVDVPMGLLDASWGGSRIEAWIGAESLRRIGGYDEALDVLALYARDPQSANARWGEAWKSWWSGKAGAARGAEPWTAEATASEGWQLAPEGLGNYRAWSPALADFTGMLWYRTTISVTAQQAAQDAVLAIGVADEVDQAFINGRGIGSGYGGGERSYALPAGVLRAGGNLVAINVLNTWSAGGLTGPVSSRALRFADGSSMPLDGRWEYRVVPVDTGTPPLAPWLSASGKTTLFNGMVAPLVGYGLRGAVWYQGESNTGDPGAYRALLRAYRDDLRMRFGPDLPLLVVQLANHGDLPLRPGESGWAGLREAQREVAGEDAYSGLAVTIDIGDRQDIHPPNKQELGRRLARVARRVVYRESLAPSGPVPRSARREGDVVAVRFGDIEQGLIAYGGPGPTGFELCGPAAGSCRYAEARIDGDQVLLRGENAATATRVRHAWADSPVVTLYDGNGLPAGPFQIDIVQSGREQP
ncbi:MAG TPA: sialate O-acetylesterase [Thermomonas sp.]|nr:sialate O-acetylesterase [Thermomonas sp.]